MNTTMIVQENEVEIKIDNNKGTHWIALTQGEKIQTSTFSIIFYDVEALDKFMYDLDLAYTLHLTKDEGGEKNEG